VWSVGDKAELDKPVKVHRRTGTISNEREKPSNGSNEKECDVILRGNKKKLRCNPKELEKKKTQSVAKRSQT